MKHLCLILTIGVAACSDNSKNISDHEYRILLALGDSISAQTQNTLSYSVKNRIQQEGVVNAIDFCNLNATDLTDSVATQHHTAIFRLTDRNRNLANAITTRNDSLAWQKMVNHKMHFLQRDETNIIYYYKPILMGMPACLNCHGKKGIDIDQNTAHTLAEKYPDDKAVNYSLGDIRGMWKIKMKENGKYIY